MNVDGVVRTLEQRGYIAEIARDPGPGQAVLFGTTATFLERMGLASLDHLPPVAEFVPGADVVEALEQGLRVDPEADLEPAGADLDATGADFDLDEPGGLASEPGPLEPADEPDPADPADLG